MKHLIVAILVATGCAAGAADEVVPTGQRWPVDDLGTPTGLIVAAAILRGSIPTIRVLHRREPQP